MKAMLLAAGRGERLRPITDTIPKSLIKVGEHSLIEHNILKLKNAGIDDIVINVCYRAQQIIEALGKGSRYGVNLTYSYEPDGYLGTGGGIFQALKLLGNAPFILISADVWSDYGLSSQLLGAQSEAHLVMVPNPAFHPQGDYALLENGLLVKEQPKLTYAGIAKIHPQLFAGCCDSRFSLSPILNDRIVSKKVTGELYEGQWFNVGTSEQLSKLRKFMRQCH